MLHQACEPAHPEPTSQDTLQTSDPTVFISDILFWTLPEQIIPPVCAYPSWTNFPKTHHKTSDPKIFISHIPLFELCRSSSPHYTTHVCANPEATFQRYTTKPQTLRFSSHTSVLNFAGAALHVTPRMWANPSWTNVPRHTTNFRTRNFHITHPCLELCRNRLHHACVPTHPEPTFQRHTTKPQNPRLSFHTSLFWTSPEQLSHITPCMCANPGPTFQRYTTKRQTLRFSSHTSVLNFAGTALHVTPGMWANPSWTNVPRHSHHACEPTHPESTSQDTLQTSDPKIFISHVPVLNFSGADYTTHVCQPWTNVPKTHHKTSDPKIFISHICFELCWNSSPCHTRHVSQPILNQRPKTHYKRLMTQFCKPILIQPPKIHLSKFECSPYRRQKCRALQKTRSNKNLVATLRPKMVLSKLQWLKLAAPTYCKNALKRFSLGWNPLAAWFI